MVFFPGAKETEFGEFRSKYRCVFDAGIEIRVSERMGTCRKLNVSGYKVNNGF